MRFPALLSCLLLQLVLLGSAHAATQVGEEASTTKDAKSEFDYDQALKLSQGAIGNQMGNHAFTNADGQPVTLSDFRGRPLIVSMVFTSCYQICPMTIRHLSKVVEKARDALGDDSFSVAIIGFDASVDTPEAMQYFANKQGISDKHWSLLSIAQEDVEALSEDLGFISFPSSNGFDHIIQATIVDADGEVYRQVYGQAFDTPLLVDPLIELVLGRPQPAQTVFSGLSSKIKLFCTTYDPVRDGYYFDYSLFIGILIGGSIIVFTVIAMGREVRKGSKRRTQL